MIMIHEDPERVVYHYTSPEGLLGMVTNRNIWSTDVRYLSDASEFKYTLTLAEHELDEFRATCTDAHSEALLINELLLSLTRAPRSRLYVASFSSEKNRLSQWRAYCPATGGFSAGIKSGALGAASRNRLLPCIYDEAEQHRLFAWVLSQILDRYRAGKPALRFAPEHPDPFAGYTEDFLGGVLLLAASFKHPSFREESEWRLVTQRAPNGEPLPLYRTGRSGIVPYIETPLSLRKEPTQIHEIIVGPNPHEDLAREAVESLLHSHGIDHTGVHLSGIPYRTW